MQVLMLMQMQDAWVTIARHHIWALAGPDPEPHIPDIHIAAAGHMNGEATHAFRYLFIQSNNDDQAVDVEKLPHVKGATFGPKQAVE